MLIFLAQNMLQLQQNGTVTRKALTFLFWCLGFVCFSFSFWQVDSFRHNNLCSSFHYFCYIFTTTYKVQYSSHARIQDYYHINQTEYGSKRALYWIRYQQRTKDDSLPPRKDNRQKICKTTFFF